MQVSEGTPTCMLLTYVNVNDVVQYLARVVAKGTRPMAVNTQRNSV